jgi:hypothetical protein
MHSSDDMYASGSYSLIVIHQKWASAEGAEARFDVVGAFFDMI